MRGPRGAEEPADRRKARGEHRQGRRGNLAEVVRLNRLGGRAGCGQPVPGKPGHVQDGGDPHDPDPGPETAPALEGQQHSGPGHERQAIAVRGHGGDQQQAGQEVSAPRKALQAHEGGEPEGDRKQDHAPVRGGRHLPCGAEEEEHEGGGQGGPRPGPGARERIEEQPARPHEQRLDDPKGQVGIGSEDAEQPLVQQDVEDDQVAAAPSQERSERVVVGCWGRKAAPTRPSRRSVPGSPRSSARRRSGRTPAGSRAAVPQSDSACERGTSRLWSAPRARCPPTPRAPAQRRGP